MIDNVDCTLRALYHDLLKGVQAVRRLKRQIRRRPDQPLDSKKEADLRKALELFNLVYGRKPTDKELRRSWYDIGDENDTNDLSDKKSEPCQSSKSGTKVPEAKSSLYDSFFSTPQKTEPPSKPLTRVTSKDERDNDARMGTKNAQLTRNQGNKTPNKTTPKSDAKSKRRAVPDDIADLLDQIPDVKSSAKKAKNNDEDDEDDFSDIDKVKRKPGKRDPFLDAENEDEGTIAEVPPKPEDKELAKTNPKEMKQQDFVKSNTPTGSHEVEKQDDDDSDMLKDIDKPKTLGARAVDVPNDNGKVEPAENDKNKEGKHLEPNNDKSNNTPNPNKPEESESSYENAQDKTGNKKNNLANANKNEKNKEMEETSDTNHQIDDSSENNQDESPENDQDKSKLHLKLKKKKNPNSDGKDEPQNETPSLEDESDDQNHSQEEDDSAKNNQDKLKLRVKKEKSPTSDGKDEPQSETPNMEDETDDETDLENDQNGDQSAQTPKNPKRKPTSKPKRKKKRSTGYLLVVKDGKLTYTKVEPHQVTSLAPEYGSLLFDETKDKKRTQMIKINDQDKLEELSKHGTEWNDQASLKIPEHLLDKLKSVDQAGGILDAIQTKDAGGVPHKTNVVLNSETPEEEHRK